MKFFLFLKKIFSKNNKKEIISTENKLGEWLKKQTPKTNHNLKKDNKEKLEEMFL